MKKLLPVMMLLALSSTAANSAWAQQAAAPCGTGLPCPSLVRPTVDVRALPAKTALTPSLTTANSAWTSLASMNQIRSQHAAVALNGKIYAWGGYVGGYSDFPTSFASLEIYDAATNTWSAGANAPVPMRGQTGVVGPDGLVYSFGDDFASTRAHQYNPTTNVWANVASLPVGVWESAAVTAPNGKIYVFAGWSGGNPATTQTQIYTPGTNSWTTGAPIPAGRHGHVALLDAAGLIHIIGGTNSTAGGNTAIATHYVYNPTTDTWNTAASLPVGLNQAGGVLGADGKLYMIGGKESYYNNATPFFSSVYVYDGTTNTWSAGTSLPMPLGETRAVVLSGNIYTIAGVSGSNTSETGTQQAVLYRASVSITTTTWTGAVSTDWFTAGNWSNGVPTATVDATIPAGQPRYPVLTTGGPVTQSLTIEDGGTLTMSGSTLDVKGNWTNNGTFTATGGTVQLGATAGRSLSGSRNSRFWNLTTSGNEVSLQTAAGVTIQRVLTIAADLRIVENSPMVLESNATGTALVVNQKSGTVSGAATVQRYIEPGKNAGLGYRHLSAPVFGTTVAAFGSGGTPLVVNADYNSSSMPGKVTPFPTIFRYDQSRLATSPATTLSAFDKGWMSPTDLSNSADLAITGFTVQLPGASTLSFTGRLGNGSGTIPLARNSGATAADAGLNFIGNPYPSPLDLRTITAAQRTNMDAAFYTYESTSQYEGGYRSFINGVGNPFIGMAQAFFVRVTEGQTSGALALNSDNRVTSFAQQAPVYRSTTGTRPLVLLELQGATLADPLYVYFQSGATAGIDAEFDAVKLPNSHGLNLSANVTEGQRLSIDGLPALGTSPVTLALSVGVPTAGTYSFQVAQLLNLEATPTYLRDRQTGAVVDLARQASYTFTVSNAKSLITDRFELLFSPQTPLATAPAALGSQVGLYPNPASQEAFVELPVALGRTAVSAKLVDALGRSVRQQVLPAQGATAHRLALVGVAKGIYTLQLATSAGLITRKLVVQ